MTIYIIYDKNGNKYQSRNNKNGAYYSLADAKRGIKNGIIHTNKRSKKMKNINGRHLLEHYEDYVIKEFELVEKEIHKV